MHSLRLRTTTDGRVEILRCLLVQRIAPYPEIGYLAESVEAGGLLRSNLVILQQRKVVNHGTSIAWSGTHARMTTHSRRGVAWVNIDKYFTGKYGGSTTTLHRHQQTSLRQNMLDSC